MSKEEDSVAWLRAICDRWHSETFDSQPEIFEFALVDLLLGALRHLCLAEVEPTGMDSVPPIGPIIVPYPINYDWENNKLCEPEISTGALRSALKDDFRSMAEETVRRLHHMARTIFLLEMTQSAAVECRDGEMDFVFLRDDRGREFEEAHQHLTDDEFNEALDQVFEPIFFGDKGLPQPQYEGDSGETEVIKDWFEFQCEIDGEGFAVRFVFGVRPPILNHDSKEAFFPLTAGLWLFDENDDEVDCSKWSREDRCAFWNCLDQMIEHNCMKLWRTTVVVTTETNLADAQSVADRYERVSAHQNRSLAEEGVAASSRVLVQDSLLARERNRHHFPPAPSCSHNEGFTSVTWDGVSYDFTKSQAVAIGMLWRAMESGNRTLNEKDIGEKIGSASDDYRLIGTFKPGGNLHPAWHAMIKSSGKGLFRLTEPANSDMIP